VSNRLSYGTAPCIPYRLLHSVSAIQLLPGCIKESAIKYRSNTLYGVFYAYFYTYALGVDNMLNYLNYMKR
jgi:hypothetical protein